MGLSDYVEVLRRRRAIILITLAVAVLGAVALTVTSDRIYASSTTLRVRDDPSLFTSGDDLQASASRDTPERRLNNEAALLSSPDFYDRVLDEAAVAASLVNDVDVLVQQDTDLITVTAESTSPRVARDVAATYADVFLADRKDRRGAALTEVSEELRARAESVREEFAAIDEEVTAAQRAGTPLDVLQAERELLADQYRELLSRADELEINAALSDRESGVIVQARLANDPIAPKPLRNLVVAVVLGLVAALALAFLVDFLDDRLKTLAEIRRAIGTVPLLATIPKDGDLANRPNERLPVLGHSHGVGVEAFRSLRTSLQLVSPDGDLHTIMVTSSAHAEGKTTIVAGLGAASAQRHRRVLLIDGDVRRPRLHTAFGLDVQGAPGLSGVIAGDVPLSKAVIDVDLPGGIRIGLLPFGTRVADPAELLASPRLDELMPALENSFDLVIIDTPPVGPVADALPLARFIDEALLVVEYRGSRRHWLTRALEQLAQARTRHVSVVVNKADTEATPFDDYYHEADRSWLAHRFASRRRSAGNGADRAIETASESQPR